MTMIAETLVFGSGEECPHEYLCLPGLAEVYGLNFKDFRVLDPGGPRTLEALGRGEIDVGVLFTTDPRLSQSPDVVLLADDRHLQPPEHVVPLVSSEVASAGPWVLDALANASRRLTTDELVRLNASVELEGSPRREVVPAWLAQVGMGSDFEVVREPAPLRIGEANFSESQTLAEIYAQALVLAGCPVERVGVCGNRDAYIPLLRDRAIDLVPEYTGSLLAFFAADNLMVSRGGLASSWREAILARLEEVLGPEGMAALEPAPAQTQNGIVVSATTAARFGLSKVSDLASEVD